MIFLFFTRFLLSVVNDKMAIKFTTDKKELLQSVKVLVLNDSVLKRNRSKTENYWHCVSAGIHTGNHKEPQGNGPHTGLSSSHVIPGKRAGLLYTVKR